MICSVLLSYLKSGPWDTHVSASWASFPPSKPMAGDCFAVPIQCHVSVDQTRW